MIHKILILAFVSMPALAQPNMMQGQGQMPHMQYCPFFGDEVGEMRDQDIKMMVKNQKDGVQITWTTSDPEKVEQLQEMAAEMKERKDRLK
jgi:hypothetical protein